MKSAYCFGFVALVYLFCACQHSGEEKLECIRKDTIPKKGELQTRGIIENIVDYSEVGTCLLKDDYGNQIRKLEKKPGHRSVTDIVEDIFHLWIDGKGVKPISWSGLVTCLRSAQLHRLADEIESAYCVGERNDGHEDIDKEFEHKQESPPTTHRRESSMDEGDARVKSGLLTMNIYTYAATVLVGIIIIFATFYSRCFRTPLPDQGARRTLISPTKLSQQARLANDGDTETNCVYIRDYWKLDDDQLSLQGKPLKGDSTTVAIIDHGFSMEHQTLHDKFTRGKITGFNFVRDENGIVDGEKWHGEGDTLHGTQIASLIGGCGFTVSDGSDGSDGSYPDGIAPDGDLYLCRAVDPKEIEDALQHLRDARPEVDIICMSLTLDLDGVEGIRNRLEELTRKGVVCIAAAGNKGPLQEYAGFPAFTSNVLSVGALKSTGQLSDMNPESRLDIYAPGEKICVPSSDNEGMEISDGTSYAAAMVAGIVSLLIQCAASVDDEVRKMYHKVEFLRRLSSSKVVNLCTDRCIRHPQDFLQRLTKDQSYVRQLVRDHYDKCAA